MINLRYHIMSLIAVLLALVLGVAAGSAVVDKGLVNQLEGNLDRLDHNLSEAASNNQKLSNQLRDLKAVQQQFDQEGGARYLPGTLASVPVLVVALRGVDEAAVSALSAAMVLAGAHPQATVWIEPKAVLASPDDAARLAQVLGVATTDVPTLQLQMADNLSLALVNALSRTRTSATVAPSTSTSSTTGAVPGVPAAGAVASPTAPVATTSPPAPSTTVSPNRSDNPLLRLLDVLRQGGFISVDRDKGVAAIDLTGGVVVMVDSASVADPGHQPAIALARQLSLHPSVPTVVAEIPSDTPKGASLVDAVRSDSQLRTRLSTVDDARSFWGWSATALAAAQLRGGTVGHYGHGKGADSLLPAGVS
ncbi:MAG: hypothetical protein JWL70_1498 [Acidimicrobiia bacterium]|nr:hypothetical protein [Acidimicrobiia bacterium]